ncbi:MAG: VWA domain-containing protein [Acidobacteria bacterium]|nr:VWA domain-containing protein [Acidobacteriota bacterium]
MNTLAALRSLARDNLAEWHNLRLDELRFWHRGETQLILTALVGLSIVLLLARLAVRRQPGRHRLALPALLRSIPRSRGAWLVQVPILLLLAGLLSFAVALADPYSALVSGQVSYPGRRIILAIDASASMETPFRADTLNPNADTEAAFFTTVAAAERFVALRRYGRYHDLVALVEFGNEAYVITPFTNDYDNILTSISLIGDPTEFKMFPDQGTIIARAIERSVDLFQAFKFLDGSGNLLVIFSDGEDTNASVHGRPLDEIVQAAVDAHVPVYFVRTNYDKGDGQHIPDDLWIPVVRQTGGEFFAAYDEPSLLSAIREIDRASAGMIQVREYGGQRPQFGVFALIAAFCLTAAIGAKLTVPYFQKFP